MSKAEDEKLAAEIQRELDAVQRDMDRARRIIANVSNEAKRIERFASRKRKK